MEILPKEQNLTVDPDLDTFISKMNIMKSDIYGKVDDSIQQAQKSRKKTMIKSISIQKSVFYFKKCLSCYITL